MPSVELVLGILSLILGAVAPLVARSVKRVPRFAAWLEKIQSNETVAAILEGLGFKVAKKQALAAERLDQLLHEFEEVSLESTGIIVEMRQQVEAQTARVKELEQRESTVQQMVQAFEAKPQGQIVAALLKLQAQYDALLHEQAKEGRRSARRDYSLFALGVLTPIAIGVILRYVFNIQF